MAPWNAQVNELFLQALDIASPEERRAFLDEACAGDAELRAKVEALLKAGEQAGSFLQAPVDAVATLAQSAEPRSERPGTVIGQYKLLEQIGEGGFGVVYLAEQTEPVRRKVALKILKPGMDTRQVVARFEAERQALAIMDHPNIAKVFDAGQTGVRSQETGVSRQESADRSQGSGGRAQGGVSPDSCHLTPDPCLLTPGSGRPYFVMELVKGVPITQFCDEQRLPPRQRLELFMTVCQGVQHAHQKGIIHRDIKPSNVLVSRHDSTPVVKVIDFGIAKALGQELTEKTVFTGLAQMLGTPLYMSPEQAGMSDLDVDTRSDIYSLGVLLYELLTGTTPFTRERFKKAGYDEIRRIIREEEPPRPSLRLSDLGSSLASGGNVDSRSESTTLASISAQRQTEPAKLTKLVKGDLDWIVMKALEKDRSRRYETANAFALDVQRYLADEPVHACPPSIGYRLKKFARRNRGRLTAAAVVGVALLIAVGVIGWALRDREARDAEAALQLAARQEKAGNDAALDLDRAELFQAQGKRADALAALERAQLLAQEALPDPARDERLAAVKERLAADDRDGEFLAGFEHIRLELQSRVNEEKSTLSDRAGFPEIVDALRRYGIDIGVTPPARVAALVGGRPETVQRDVIAALDMCSKLAPEDDEKTRAWLFTTLIEADKDTWRMKVRKAIADRQLKELEPLAREADVTKHPPSFLLNLAIRLPRKAGLELLERIQRAHHGDVWANGRFALGLLESGQAAKAVRYFTAALALRPDNAGLYVNRAAALIKARELDAALADYRHAVDLAPRYAAARVGLGRVLHAKGRYDEAIKEYEEAIRLQPNFHEAHHDLGMAFRAKGRFDDEINAFNDAIRIKPGYAQAHFQLGIAYRREGKVDEAIAACRQATVVKPDYEAAHHTLGELLYGRGRLDEAITVYHEIIRLGVDDIACYNLGNALRDQGLLDDAIVAFQEAVRIRPAYAKAYCNLGQVLMWKGLLDEAMEACRWAIVVKPDLAEAHGNLGLILKERGDFREALKSLQLGDQLGRKDPRWRSHEELLRECEGLIALDERLPDFLVRKRTAAGFTEQIDLAKLCSIKRLNLPRFASMRKPSLTLLDGW